MATTNTIDSNVSGFRLAEEVEDCIGVLPTTPLWRPHEPNSYADFGGEISTVARRPINDSRQQKKGVTTDLDASGALNEDLTQENWQADLQGFMFANLRLKAQTQQALIDQVQEDVAVNNVDGTTEDFDIDNLEVQSAVIAVGGTGYAVGDTFDISAGTTSGAGATGTVLTESGGVVATVTINRRGTYSIVPASPAATVATSGSGDDALTLTLTTGAIATYFANDLLFASGFTNTANNGLHVVDTFVGDIAVGVTTDLTVEASPPTDAHIAVVGHQFATTDVDIANTGSAFPTLTSAAKDLTELGITPGEWIFIGGDTSVTQFATSANNGFARVRSVTTTVITFDKTASTMVTDAGTGKTVQIFLGRVLRNEQAALQRRRTYQAERTLGEDANGTMSEYLVGAVPGEFVINVPTADKLVVDASYVATDNEQRTGTTGPKTGTKPAIVEADAFNTSSDFSRIKISTVSTTDGAPTALFAFATELTVTINNNLTPNKAVGTLGAIEVTSGLFQVSAAITAYFADVTAVQAVRNNDDVTIDFATVKDNAGFVLDIPLVSLGDGRLNVEIDNPITLPLTADAGDGSAVNSSLDYTLMFTFFDYLPTLADT